MGVKESINERTDMRTRQALRLDIPHGARVDAQFSRELLLRQSERSASTPDSLSQCLPLRRGVVAQEPDDRRQVPELRLGAPVLPVVDRAGADPDLGCYLFLQEPEIESALPNVVTNGNKLGRIGRIRRYRSGKRQTAKR